MKRIVIDASSAILLFKAGLFDELLGAYQVALAQSVYQEISRAGYPGSKNFGRYYQNRQIEVLSLNRSAKISPDLTAALSALGNGEKDTIMLYLNGEGEFVVIDDGRGAGLCRVQHIPYINSLLTAKVLLISGEIDPAGFQNAFNTLVRIGRYSRKIIDYALTCPSKAMALFTPGLL